MRFERFKTAAAAEERSYRASNGSTDARANGLRFPADACMESYKN
jgi:hypothetical protein